MSDQLQGRSSEVDTLAGDPQVASGASWPLEPFGEPAGTLLRGYERYRTVNPDQAEEAISNFLSPHRLTVHGGGGRFAAVGNVAEAGAISLCQMSYGQEVTVDRPAQDDPYVAVLIPICGRLLVRLKNTEFVATPYDCVAALSQRESVRLLWSKDSRVLTLRADTTALQTALLGLSPRADSSALRLDSVKLVGSQRQALLGIAATAQPPYDVATLTNRLRGLEPVDLKAAMLGIHQRPSHSANGLDATVIRRAADGDRTAAGGRRAGSHQAGQ